MQGTGPLFHIKTGMVPVVCQRLLSRGFRFLSSLFSDTREKCFFLAASRSASGRPVWADTEDSRSTREKNFWYLRYQNDHIFWCEGKILSLN